MRMKKRVMSVLLCFCMVLTLAGGLAPTAQATSYSFGKAPEILNTIATGYSQKLSDAIKDLIYDSDYSDLLPQHDTTGTTLRSYDTFGDWAWPITNADKFDSSVVDRGRKVNWGWGSAGCMSYAQFFTYSVYGTIGKKGASVKLNKDNVQPLKDFLANYVQPGEHLRTNDQPHSVIYLCDGTENGQAGFYIAEYWGGAKKDSSGNYVRSAESDQLYLRFYTYEAFAEKYNGKTWSVYDSYETSDYANESPAPGTPAPQNVSRDIVLVLDISGSMASQNRLTNTQKAATNFLKKVLDGSHNTQVALVTYGSNSRVIQNLTSDLGTLLTQVEGLRTTGNTNMYGGMKDAGDILAASIADEKAIVVMTDGEANEGVTSTAYTAITDEGDQINLDRYDSAIYQLADTYLKTNGYTIYSLGFGLTTNSSAYDLMKHIASFDSVGERCFWLVNDGNVDDLVFAYEDMAGDVTAQNRTTIVIKCPVDVSISLDGVALDRTNRETSFGNVTVTEVEDGWSYVFRLDNDRNYDVKMVGTGEGSMDFRITYYHEGQQEYRAFLNVPITLGTVITTSATDWRADFALYIDENSDGEIDEGWAASTNETVIGPSAEIIEQIRPTGDDSDGRPAPDVEDATITFVLSDDDAKWADGTNAPKLIPAVDGKIVPPVAPVKDGYKFVGWYTNNNVKVDENTTVTQDTTLYARFAWIDPNAPDQDQPNTYEFITVPTVEGGKVTVFPQTAAPGDYVTLIVTPNAGYTLDELKVADNWVLLTESVNGTYSFIMPDFPIWLDVSFKKIATEVPSVTVPDIDTSDGFVPPPYYAKIAFSDVDDSDWFSNCVEFVQRRGLMTGVSANRFDPNGTASRAMIWTILARLDGFDVVDGSGIWYERSRVWAQRKGITDGSDPDGDVTREQLVTMLWRYEGKPSRYSNQIASYADGASVSSYAVSAMNWAVATGLIEGSGGKLNPQGTATRAELAAILQRYCKDMF